MSETIPDDIMKAAGQCLGDVMNCVDYDDRSDCPGPEWAIGDATEFIARAILAERARCAKIAELHAGSWLLRLSAEARTSKFFRDKVQHKIETCEAVASAIRTPSTGEET